jgi:hypothetical protein
MPWFELEDAAAKGFSREAWESWIQSGQATSYVDGIGRRMVWIDEAAPVHYALQGFTHELVQLREEVSRLRHELRTTLGNQPTAAQPGEAPVELSALATSTLDMVGQQWEGSDRELERQAGLPLRFLTKARRGERNGKRAEVSWSKLRQFLRAA